MNKLEDDFHCIGDDFHETEDDIHKAKDVVHEAGDEIHWTEDKIHKTEVDIQKNRKLHPIQRGQTRQLSHKLSPRFALYAKFKTMGLKMVNTQLSGFYILKLHSS